MWKKYLIRAVWLALLAGLGVAGWKWYNSGSDTGEVTYKTGPIKRGTVMETVLTTGTLQPSQTVNVGSQVSGMVTRLYVDWNSQVHKGEVIAEIDPRVSRSQFVQAQADLENAEAGVLNNQASLQNQVSNLKTMRAALLTAQADVDTARGAILTARAQRTEARAGLDKARANLGVAVLTLNRDLAVRKEDLIPQATVDQAQATRDAAEADVRTAEGQVEASEAGLQAAQIKLRTTLTAVESARDKVDAAASQVSGAHAQVEAAQALVKRAEANTEQSKLDLSYTIIHSPVDGIVLERNVDQGQTIQASYNTPQLYSIGTNLKHMQLVASLSESDMSRVYRGEKATFTVDAYPDDKFDGTVIQVRNKATTTDNVVTYQVVIAVENPVLKLRPGMTANITLQVREHKKALLVSNAALRWKPQEDPSATPTPTPSASSSAAAKASPSPSPSPHPKVLAGAAALLPDETDHQKVWVLQGKTPVSIDVTTGLSDDSNTEVLGGLKEGQEVITGATYPTRAERKDLF